MSLRRSAATAAAVLTVAAGALVAVSSTASAATGPATPAWVTAALADQYQLGNSLPLRDAPWWGTHNSFNSPKEMGPALSALDPNQKIKIAGQLDLGARQLELDVHWVPTVRRFSKTVYAPVVCHALSGGVGCTIEKPLGPVLDEVAGWLREPAHRDQVLLVYLEDDLQNRTGYQTAGQLIADHLGSLVYRPAGGCTPMPLQLTRDQVLAGGAQVILVGNSCGVGSPAAWQSEVFDWSHSHLEAQPVTYSDYPTCGSDFTRAQYDSTMVRYFEEMGHLSTLAGQGGWPITPTVAAEMQRCGVDLESLDFLVPGDPRLPALVWSWAPNEPNMPGGCTVQGSDARWISGSCTASRRVACQAADGSWVVPAVAVPQADAAASCTAAGATFAVPRTGYQNQLLRAAAGTDQVWLNFSR
jgi:hypothetical protein